MQSPVTGATTTPQQRDIVMTISSVPAPWVPYQALTGIDPSHSAEIATDGGSGDV